MLDIDTSSPPFDQLRAVRRLGTARGGRSADAEAHGRHHLYAAQDRRTAIPVLIKVMSKPGLVYERSAANEIATLGTINRELPHSRYFPILKDHGRLPDHRVYIVMSLFDEFPLATTIGSEHMPARLVGNLRTAMEISKALAELHRLSIFHIDLNPMNVLYRAEKGRPVIRIVDFESSYESARHQAGDFYDPPTTPGYAAPEVFRQAPDARADVYSLGAVLYTMLAGYGWTWTGEVDGSVSADRSLDPELTAILAAAVEPDPEKRYPSIAPFQAALGAYLESIWPGRAG